MNIRNLFYDDSPPPPRKTIVANIVVPGDHPAAAIPKSSVIPTAMAVRTLELRVIPPSGPLAVFLTIRASLAKFIPDSAARTAAALETLNGQGSSREMLLANIQDAKDNLARELSNFAVARDQRTEQEVLSRRKDAEAIGAELSRLREQVDKLETEQAGLRAAANDAAMRIAGGSGEFIAAVESVAAQLDELKGQI